MICINCKETMKKVKLIGNVTGMNMYVSNKEKGIFESEQRSNVSTYVCPNCGKIELIADTPNIFN